jgi:hypothetical protein
MTDDHSMMDADPMANTEQCTATASSTGERCKQPAIPGGNVCRFHGGSAPQVKEAADERLERLARELLAEFEPRINDLLEEYDRAQDAGEKTKIHRELRQAVTDILDRADHGPTETREHTGEDGGPLMILETDGDDTT